MNKRILLSIFAFLFIVISIHSVDAANVKLWEYDPDNETDSTSCQGWTKLVNDFTIEDIYSGNKSCNPTGDNSRMNRSIGVGFDLDSTQGCFEHHITIEQNSNDIIRIYIPMNHTRKTRFGTLNNAVFKYLDSDSVEQGTGDFTNNKNETLIVRVQGSNFNASIAGEQWANCTNKCESGNDGASGNTNTHSIMIQGQGIGDSLYFHNWLIYNCSAAPAADTTPPGVILINVTSTAGGIIYDGTTDLRLSGDFIDTNDTTPTIRVDTNENACVAVMYNNTNMTYADIVANNSALNGSTTCGVTEHTWTLHANFTRSIGLHNFSIGAKDADGNDNATGKFTINITDGSGPTIDLGIVSDHTYFRLDKPFALNFTAFDNFATTLSCSMYINSTLNQTDFSVSNGTLTSWTAENISVGYWNYNVSCNDTHGNIDSNSTFFWVNTSTATIDNIYLDGINDSRNYELNTTAHLVCNATTVCDPGDCEDFTLTVNDNDGTSFTGNPIDVNYTIDLLRESNFTNSTNISARWPGKSINLTTSGNFSFRIDNRTDITNAQVNVSGHGASAPVNVTFTINNTITAILPGELHLNLLNQTQLVVSGVTYGAYNFSFSTAGAITFNVNLSSSAGDFKNITLDLTGFDLAEGNELDFDESFNGTFILNKTLSFGINNTPGYFDDLESNTSGRWSYSSSTGADTLDFKYTNHELILNVVDEGEATVDIDYTDAFADFRNTSEINFMAYYRVLVSGCAAGGGTDPCPTTTAIATLYATDGTDKVSLFTDSETQSSCSSCNQGTASKENAYNFTLKKKSSDYKNWELFTNGSSQGTKDISSLNFNNQIKLQWETETDRSCPSTCQNRDARVRWNLSEVKWGGAVLGRHGNGTYERRGNFTSATINVTSSNVTRILLNKKDYVPSNTQIQYYVALNCNKTLPSFEKVTPNEFHTFADQGQNICWRAHLNSSVNTSSPIVRHVSIDVTSAIIGNISIDAGDDGDIEFSSNIALNASNSPQVVNISSSHIDDYFSANVVDEKTFLFPISIIVNDSGIAQVSNLDALQNPNPIALNKTSLEFCEDCKVNVSFTNGDLVLDDLRIDFEGSKNISLVCSTKQKDIRAKTSKFNITEAFSSFQFFPKTVNDTNVSPFGQTRSKPFWNITGKAYDIPFNLSTRLNSSLNACVNFSASTKYLSENFSLSTTSRQVMNNVALDVDNGTWFYISLNDCNASAFRFFNPAICTESICESCVITHDFGGIC